MIYSFILTHVKKKEEKKSVMLMLWPLGMDFVLTVVIFLDVFVVFYDFIYSILHTQYFINNACGWVKA